MGRPPTKTPNDELDKFLLRMPDGLRDRLGVAAIQNNRSMNAEAVSRLEFSLQAHPHAYLIRALIDLQEKLLSGTEELDVPHMLQNEIRELALVRGVSPQKLLTALLLEAMNHLDDDTELGQEFSKRIDRLREEDV